MPDFSKPWCYYVDPHQEPPGPDKPGYIPSAVFQNDPGHYPMLGNGPHAEPWYWGKTIEEAQAACLAQNTKLGLSQHEVDEIVSSSINASCRQDTGYRRALDRWTGMRRE